MAAIDRILANVTKAAADTESSFKSSAVVMAENYLLNPTQAITQSRAVVMKQAEFIAWSRAKQAAEMCVRDGLGAEGYLEMVESMLGLVVSTLANDSPSTCELSNGVARIQTQAEYRAFSRAVERARAEIKAD